MKDSKLTPAQILFPLSLVAFVLCLAIAFQFSEVMSGREELHRARASQEKPLQEANRLKAQFTALALGTNKLAHDGDKDAQALVERMKKSGITFEAPPGQANGAEGTATPTPTADTSKP